MPLTPVGQIPYPQGSDKPLIPADMKALADRTDGWVSGMDSALDGRITAVGSRLDAAGVRLGNTATNLNSANALMTSAVGVFAVEDPALTAVESRLATQDTTASTLQGRYTTDYNNLNNFANRTPMGLAKIINASSTVTTGSSVTQWFGISYFNLGAATSGTFRVSFSASVKANNVNTGSVELRVCSGVGASGTPSWSQFHTQTFFRQVYDQGFQSFMMCTMATVNVGSPGGSIILALGATGDGTMNYSVKINSGSIQYMVAA